MAFRSLCWKKQPIGITNFTKGIIFSVLIGNDLGCGMVLYDIETKCK